MDKLDRIIHEAVHRSVKNFLKENVDMNDTSVDIVFFKLHEIIDEYGGFNADMWDALAQRCQRQAQMKRFRQNN